MSALFLPKQHKVVSGHTVLSNSNIASVSGEIQHAIRALQDAQGSSRILLLIDQLDLLMAAGGDQIHAVELGEMVMGLREVCYGSAMAKESKELTKPRMCMQL